MLEYEFETVRTGLNSRGFMGEQRLETRKQRESILRRAAPGWRLAAAMPAAQKMGHCLETMDLAFEREKPEA